MIYENLCINCMKEKPIANGVCPYCGFDNTKYHAAEYQLPLYTQLSDGRYIIGKAIGSGGFGITYIAFDTRLKIPVAIKELFVSNKVTRRNGRTVLMNTTESGIRQYEDIKRRFMQEARTMAELENIDGVVKVKDFFSANDTAYIVMEYLNGKTLKELLQENKKRIPLERIVTLLEPVISSLSQMHKAGIIHRDISLDNIMVTKDGRVKLIDLGGEKRLGEYDNEDQTIAIKKSAYTPIEQILGKSSNIGSWTDVYALAVTIYRCICGRFPKAAADRSSDKDIERPSKLGVKITKKQEEILLKALALERKNRVQTVEQLLDGLKEKKKKRKLPIVLILFAILVAGIGGGLLFERNKKVTIEGGTYMIASYSNPDLVLEIPTDYYISGTSIVLGKSDNSNSQKFYIKEKNDKSYYISAVCSDHSVTADNESDTYNNDLIQAEFSDELSQEQSWIFESAGKGTYYIKSGNGLYITCHNDKVASEINVELSEDKNNESSKWVLISTYRNQEDLVTPISGTVIGLVEGVYQITPLTNSEQQLSFIDNEWKVTSGNSNIEQKFYVTNNANNENGITAVLNGTGLLGETGEQIWKIVFAQRGSYYIQDSYGKVLTLNPKDGSVSLADLEEGADSKYQRWIIKETELTDLDELYIVLESGEHFKLLNRANYDLCVAARNDSVQEGTTLQLIQKGNGASYQFTFKEIKKRKYKIINDYSKNIVAVSKEIDNSARLVSDTLENEQLWSFEAAENGFFYLKSMDGYYLGVDLSQNTTVLFDQEPDNRKGFQWKILSIN